MLLAVIEASVFNHEDAVDGMGVLFHVAWVVLTTGGTMIF